MWPRWRARICSESVVRRQNHLQTTSTVAENYGKLRKTVFRCTIPTLGMYFAAIGLHQASFPPDERLAGAGSGRKASWPRAPDSGSPYPPPSCCYGPVVLRKTAQNYFALHYVGYCCVIYSTRSSSSVISAWCTAGRSRINMEGILAHCGESMVAIAASNVLLRLSSVTENYAKLLAASLPTVRAFLAYPRGFLNHVPKCGQISKKRTNFFIGLCSKTLKTAFRTKSTTKKCSNFSHRRNIS